MPPSGYEPFLCAISENPEDDTVRLVYADWLDENGDPDRAEFIRLHLERGRANERGPRQDPHVGRAWELRQKHEDTWRSEMPELQGVTWGRFLRGFISEVTIDRTDLLLTPGNKLLAVTPIEFLNLRTCDDTIAPAVFGLPALSNLRGLRIAVDLNSAVWDELISCPRFSNLRHLIVDPPTHISNRADRRALLRLARYAYFPRLELLHVGLDIGSDTQAELTKRFRRVTGIEEIFEPL